MTRLSCVADSEDESVGAAVQKERALAMCVRGGSISCRRVKEGRTDGVSKRRCESLGGGSAHLRLIAVTVVAERRKRVPPPRNDVHDDV